MQLADVVFCITLNILELSADEASVHGMAVVLHTEGLTLVTVVFAEPNNSGYGWKYSMSCLQMIKLHELHSNKSFPLGIRVFKRGKNTNIYQIFVKEKYNLEALKETLFSNSTRACT